MRKHAPLFLSFLFALTYYNGIGQSSTDNLRQYPNDLQLLSTFKYNNSHIATKGHPQGDLLFEQSGMGIGARMQFGNWGLAITVPTRLFITDRKGRTAGLQLQLFPKAFFVDAGISRMKGFQKLEQNASVIGQNAFYQNAQIWHFHFKPTYIFSPNRFSIRAAIQFTERQIKSGGSFLASLRSEYILLNKNKKSKTADNIVSTDNTGMVAYSFMQNGIEAGYAYNFVFADALFISAIASTGLAHTKTAYQVEGNKYAFHKWQILPSANVDLSFGYNGDRYVAAFHLLYRQRSIHAQDIEMNVNDWSLHFTCGFRLYAPHIRRRLDQYGARFAQYFVPVR